VKPHEALRVAVDALGAYTQHLELIAARMTETAVLTRGLVINDVLWSGPVAIGPDGHWTHSFQVPFAAVVVLNMNAAVVQVSNAGPAVGPPGPGPGSFTVPATAFARRNLAGREITVYGVAAQLVEIEVLARPVEPVVNIV
jgi:hypothetical protein